LPFGQVEYDIRDHVMKAPDPKRPGDFISISGSKMRQLAAQGAQPCNIHKELPTDLLEANCIPPGFMVQSGWDIVCDYYQNVESTRWVPFSIMNVDPLVARGARVTGKYGTMAFELQPVLMGKPVSPWHDVSLFASEASELYNFIVEIPMYSTAKMEVMKDRPGNPIMQDTKDNVPRYYSYGTPFFNYGLLPQTWEDPSYKDPRTGAYGDGDPIDAIEIGMGPLAMGSIVPVKVLGSMELIDEGETDHKIIVLRQTDQHFDSIDTVADLERYFPGTVDRLVDWLKNYKTSDGKPQNTLTSDEPTSPAAAKAIITEVSEFYQSLILGEVAQPDGYYLPTLKRA
jgi:3'-phosphoadenosine 5'-phosphosulfate synthase